MKMKHIEVALTDLRESPYQPRRINPEDPAIKELAASLKEVGLMQPIVVRKIEPRGVYETIAGHRRAFAARLAGYDTIQANLVEVTDAQAAEMCITENLERKDLTPLEESQGVAQLVTNGVTVADVATRLGRSAAWVRSRRMISGLPETVKDMVRDGEMRTWPIESLVELAKSREMLKEDDFNELIDAFGHSAADRVPAPRDLRRYVEEEFMMELKEDIFPDMTPCKECMNRTGRFQYLFDVEEEGLGNCLNKECFKKRTQAAKQARFESFISGLQRPKRDYKFLFNERDIEANHLEIPKDVEEQGYIKQFWPVIHEDIPEEEESNYIFVIYVKQSWNAEEREYDWNAEYGYYHSPAAASGDGDEVGDGDFASESVEDHEARLIRNKRNFLAEDFIERDIRLMLAKLIYDYKHGKADSSKFPSFLRMGGAPIARRAAEVVGVMAARGFIFREDSDEDLFTSCIDEGFVATPQIEERLLTMIFFHGDDCIRKMYCDEDEEGTFTKKMHDETMEGLFGSDWETSLERRRAQYLEAVEEVTDSMSYKDISVKHVENFVDKVKDFMWEQFGVIVEMPCEEDEEGGGDSASTSTEDSAGASDEDSASTSTEDSAGAFDEDSASTSTEDSAGASAEDCEAEDDLE